MRVEEQDKEGKPRSKGMISDQAPGGMASS